MSGKEFKRKDRRDIVELEFIYLGKQFAVVEDEGEGEVKDMKSLIHKGWDNSRHRSQE